eukprot:TRINITY_DN80127_c0_g1_i1.p1 TRINITY_DN80127_c0_g1~~TRINITY_DN80127_c0_g1_i1.p1  ORF type:complete len:774 (+),score=200.99 TRINITY_DN80127_c0_g1_i1:93-2414(+)
MLSFLPKFLVAGCTEILKKAKGEGGEDAVDEDDEEIQGQDHVFTFYDDLSTEEQRTLDDDFDSIDPEEVEEAWHAGQDVGNFVVQGVATVPPYLMNWDLKKPPVLQPGANLTKLSDVSDRKKLGWLNFGLELYSKDRVAIVILSGGRDSRIGGDVPKGVLDVGLLSHKSIFQLYVERIRRLQHLVQRKFKRSVHIPVYIMCNKENKEIVEDFFRENDFFGIREQDVLFFCQSYYPICDKRGKFLMSEKHKIALAPNGNGGIFRALVEEGMVSDMKSRGVSSLYVCSIDNVLTKVGDPMFLGYCETCKAQAGIKTVEKVLPDERFGIFCSQVHRDVFEDVDGDGKLDAVSKVKAAVVEFFELPDDLKKRRRQAGSSGMPLELNSGNLSQYFFKVDFVKKVAHAHFKKWHLIPKSLPHVDMRTGGLVTPAKEEKNGRRIEMFLFDAFEHCRSVVGLQVARTEHAIVKNVTGHDSPQTALQAMGRLHQQWIIAAGGSFVGSKVASESEDLKCEISPLASYDGEDLYGNFPKQINLPFYLPSQQEFTQFSAATTPQARRPSTHYLDWQSDIARYELEVELHGQLGTVLEMMEDPSRYEYVGERATEEDEVLPPTPREKDGKDRRRGSDSPREDGSDAGSGGGSARDGEDGSQDDISARRGRGRGKVKKGDDAEEQEGEEEEKEAQESPSSARVVQSGELEAEEEQEEKQEEKQEKTEEKQKEGSGSLEGLEALETGIPGQFSTKTTAAAEKRKEYWGEKDKTQDGGGADSDSASAAS